MREGLEACFHVQIVTKKKTTTTTAAAKRHNNKPKGPAKVELLDSRRAFQMGIVLKKIGITAGDVCTALLQLDKTVLTEDHLTIIRAIMPDQDEAKAIKNYFRTVPGAALDKLRDIEAYVAQLLQVPRLPGKVAVFELALHYRQHISDLTDQINTIRTASTQLLESRALKDLLLRIMAVGNYLNHGTVRGGATGFRLTSLEKLSHVRSQDPLRARTLLHFIAIECRESVLLLDDELSCLEAASRCSEETVDMLMNSLRGGLTKLTSELAAGTRDLHRRKQQQQERARDEARELVDMLTTSSDDTSVEKLVPTKASKLLGVADDNNNSNNKKKPRKRSRLLGLVGHKDDSNEQQQQPQKQQGSAPDMSQLPKKFGGTGCQSGAVSSRLRTISPPPPPTTTTTTTTTTTSDGRPRNESQTEVEHYMSILEPVKRTLSEQVNELIAARQLTQQQNELLTQSFGEDINKLPIDSLFNMMLTFKHNIQRALDEFVDLF